ncbi:MAG TPA: FAD-binding oxidoreductase [Capillimicrobium sp.]|jgi:FAD/FMN-containing dehydrogenase
MPNDTALSPDLDALRRAIAGRLLLPGDDGYDAARTMANAGAERRPAAILQPADARDVARAVTHARETGMALTVRGGGHSFVGHGAADGALTIDMRSMSEITIDPVAREAWAQAGATAEQYTAAAGAHGLATGFGDAGGVGIAGLTLGGGIGWLTRKHGMTIDHLLAVELVTADGELREVDAQRDPDLFWALRGGGGNFGVVTRLRFRLLALETVLAGMVILPADLDTLTGVIAAGEAAPEELAIIARVTALPPLPFIPAERRGEPAIIAGVAWCGEPAAGEQALEPIRRLAEPIVDLVQAIPYAEIYGHEGPPRAAFAVRSALLDELDEAAAAALLDGVWEKGTGHASVEVRVLGGAMARVPADATAFAHRQRRLMVTVGAMSEHPADMPALEASASRRAAAAGLNGRDGYVNYLGDQPAALASAYPEATARRLAEVKRRYDPANLLRSNFNIAPAV